MWRGNSNDVMASCFRERGSVTRSRGPMPDGLADDAIPIRFAIQDRWIGASSGGTQAAGLSSLENGLRPFSRLATEWLQDA